MIVHPELLCSAPGAGGDIQDGLGLWFYLYLLGLAAEEVSMRMVQFPGSHACSPTSQSRDTSLSCVLLVLTTDSENGFHLVLIGADHCLPAVLASLWSLHLQLWIQCSMGGCPSPRPQGTHPTVDGFFWTFWIP